MHAIDRPGRVPGVHTGAGTNQDSLSSPTSSTHRVLHQEAKGHKEQKEREHEAKEDADGSRGPIPTHQYQKPLKLSDFFGLLVGKDKFADVHFLIGSERIPGHRLVLAASSPVFESMLYPVAAEADTRLPLELVISGTSVETFRSMLHCIYSDQAQVTLQNLPLLVEVAAKYQLYKLYLACRTFMERCLTVDQCCLMFNLGPCLLHDESFGLDFIREHAELVVAGASFKDLDQHRLKFLLEDDQLAVDEVPLLQATIRWAASECSRRELPASKEHVRLVLEGLLPHLRLPTLDVAQLAAHVAPSEVLSPLELLELYSYVAQSPDTRVPCSLPYNCKPRQGGFLAKDSRLLDRKHKTEILRLFGLKSSSTKNLTLGLLYRGSRDGFTAAAFHSKCDGQPGTITFIRPLGNNNLFGGYFADSWATSGAYSSAESWIFSLENKLGTPMKLLPHNSNNNTYNHASYGPTWGGGHDLHINNNMLGVLSYTNPSNYQQLAPGYSGSFTKDLFAGVYKFAVAEIETFRVDIK